MHYTMTSLVLATVAIGQAAAASVGHVHSAYHNHALRHAEFKRAESTRVEKRASLRDLDISKLTSMGLTAMGVNSYSAGSPVWIGADSPYTNEFSNDSGEDIVLICWGVAGSWVNAVQPLITVSMAAGDKTTLSYADGASGACSAIYPETALVMGQVSNTWMEFTFGQWGVVDVSREVNMAGRGMSVVGPSCTTNMDTCVFVCPEGQNTCMLEYILQNCENGSQPGANYGTFAGMPSGGCGGMGAAAALKTSLT